MWPTTSTGQVRYGLLRLAGLAVRFKFKPVSSRLDPIELVQVAFQGWLASTAALPAYPGPPPKSTGYRLQRTMDTGTACGPACGQHRQHRQHPDALLEGFIDLLNHYLRGPPKPHPSHAQYPSPITHYHYPAVPISIAWPLAWLV